MRKAICIVILAVAFVFALSVTIFAQTPTGNWPKFQRDAYNSGRSPATTIAKPVVKWTTTIPGISTANPGNIPNWITRTGLVIDAQGASYVSTSSETSSSGQKTADEAIVKIDANGNYLWTSDKPTYTNGYALWNGVTLDDYNGSQLLIAGPGTNYSTATPKVIDPANDRIYAIDRATGLTQWYTEDMYNYYNTATTANYNVPTIGPDGTIYSHMQYLSYDTTGMCFGIDPSTHLVRWTFNGDSTTPKGTGYGLGTWPIKVVDGKTRLFVAGQVAYNQTNSSRSIYCLEDDGTSVTELWNGDAAAHDGVPCLSNDGNTVYITNADCYRYQIGHTFSYSMSAWDASTGVNKWKYDTKSQLAYPPAIGADGTLYVGGTFMYDYLIDDLGKISAVTDNGTSATTKWDLILPDDYWSDCSNVVVVNTNPQVIYVGVGNAKDYRHPGVIPGGRVYAIADMGTYGKILWTYQSADSSTTGWPSTLAVADDGTLRVGWGDKVLCFDTGFDANNPNGISGYVKDSAGNPISDAWVAASTSPRPLPDNLDRVWTKTDVNGYYQIGVKTAGTWYVAACAQGYQGSEDQAVNIASTSDVAKVDFTLPKANYNRAYVAFVTMDGANSSWPAINGVDGNISTVTRSSALPGTLQVDLGVNRTISEAVIYWEWAFGRIFTVDYLPDGEDPATATWNTIYSTQNGNEGFPLIWNHASTQTAAQGGSTFYSASPSCKTGCDMIKFSPITARYWRICVTATNDNFYRLANGFSPAYTAIVDFELRDVTRTGSPAKSIADVKSAEDGDGINITNAVITAVSGGGIPDGSIYVETQDRTAGVRIDISGLSSFVYGTGDRVTIWGRIYTDTDGNKYIYAVSCSRTSDAIPVGALGMNNNAIAADNAKGLFVKTWGKVSASDDTSFTISDGSSAAVKVLCGSIEKPSIGDVVRVRGIVGKDASGPVLYMRNERVDWVLGNSDNQPLPLPGPYKYPREWLICGPFSDDNSSDQYYRISHDFIYDATSGALDEVTVCPKVGDMCGSNQWTYASTRTDKDSTLRFTTSSTNQVYYAFMWLWSPVDIPYPGITLWVGSSDSNEIIINDQSGAGSLGTRSSVGYGQDSYNIPINMGFNRVLVKVENVSGSCEFNVLFADPANPGTGAYGKSVGMPGLGYLLDYTP